MEAKKETAKELAIKATEAEKLALVSVNKMEVEALEIKATSDNALTTIDKGQATGVMRSIIHGEKDAIEVKAQINETVIRELDAVDASALHAVLCMADTVCRTFDELREMSAERGMSGKYTKEKQIFFYRRWADVLTDEKIKKLVCIAQAIQGGYHIVYNKNKTISVKRNISKHDYSLLSARFYRVTKIPTLNESGEKQYMANGKPCKENDKGAKLVTKDLKVYVKLHKDFKARAFKFASAKFTPEAWYFTNTGEKTALAITENETPEQIAQ